MPASSGDGSRVSHPDPLARSGDVSDRDCEGAPGGGTSSGRDHGPRQYAVRRANRSERRTPCPEQIAAVFGWMAAGRAGRGVAPPLEWTARGQPTLPAVRRDLGAGPPSGGRLPHIRVQCEWGLASGSATLRRPSALPGVSRMGWRAYSQGHMGRRSRQPLPHRARASLNSNGILE
jgi:hypothetical protein